MVGEAQEEMTAMLRRTSIGVVLALLVALWSQPSLAATNIVKSCSRQGDKTVIPLSISYNHFVSMPTGNKSDYLSAWLQGYATALDPNFCSKRVHNCLKSTSMSQRIAMVEKEAAKKLKVWGGGGYLAIFIVNSFVAPCLRGEIPLK